jgi:meiotically up-regulated gene 157 (Mug157) protein
LLNLPALDFVSEDDPTFARTYEWLHSTNYEYSYTGKSFGLPGSYRLRFTTSWSVADHLLLHRGREQALNVIHGTNWDGGIISEGIDPASGMVDHDGRAFATAAGYVGHAICAAYCTDKK